MRLQYVAASIAGLTDSDAAIVSRVRARRAPREIQLLDRTLLHAPPVADGWNSFFGSIRSRTSISDDIRELAISRVAVLTHSQYEWDHHAPLAVKAGISEAAIKVEGSGGADGLTAKQRATLTYTDAMTLQVQVPEQVFRELQAHFSPREVVEITATVAVYNCTARFLVALDVGECNSAMDVQKWDSLGRED